MLGHARHVVEILVLGVGAEIRGALLLFRKIGNEFDQIVDGPVGDADGARRERRIAAALRKRRAFEHGDARALLARGKRRAQRRIAGPDDDHVLLIHGVPLFLLTQPAWTAAKCGIPGLRCAPSGLPGAHHSGGAFAASASPRRSAAPPASTAARSSHNRRISASEYPASRSTSTLCSPSRGGGRSIPGPARLHRLAIPANLILPSLGCSISSNSPTALRCGSSIRRSRSLSGPQGIHASR